MNPADTDDLDQTDEVPAYEISDEQLEVAAALPLGTPTAGGWMSSSAQCC
jgi:hypothetical protein